MTGDTQVSVEVVGFGHVADRQVARRQRVAESLSSRRAEIETAIQETSNILATAAAGQAEEGWAVTELEATFGLTITADAGVLVSRIGAEATLEVRILIERR